MAIGIAEGLVEMIVAALVGAWLYKEDGAGLPAKNDETGIGLWFSDRERIAYFEASTTMVTYRFSSAAAREDLIHIPVPEDFSPLLIGEPRAAAERCP